MRSRSVQAVGGATEVTRRAVQLFVLLGLAVAAYVGLSFLDHAAWADAGSIGDLGAADPVVTAKATVADLGKAVPGAAANLPQKIQSPKAQAPKVQATAKIHASKTSASVQIRRSK